MPDNPQTREDVLPVEQIDRDAAADFMFECSPYLGDCGMKASVELALRQAFARHHHSALSTDALREALERQMNEYDEDVQCLPSSVLRERGLVWLEGWFDLSAAALSTKAPLSMEGLEG